MASDSWEGGHPADQEQFQRLSSYGVDIWWRKQAPAEAVTHTVDSVGLQHGEGELSTVCPSVVTAKGSRDSGLITSALSGDTVICLLAVWHF